MKWINNASLKLFVIYRVILGILILIFYYSWNKFILNKS
jgi:undecaprenyl pyrophosphate phosphatase UppP